MKLVIDCLTKNFFNFKGRARRKEYWLFTLVCFCLCLILVIIEEAFFDRKTGKYVEVLLLTVMARIVLFIPGLSVTFRRLHDVNKSGWWCLLVPALSVPSLAIGMVLHESKWALPFLFMPSVALIWYLVILCKKGAPGKNSYGEDPLDDTCKVQTT